MKTVDREALGGHGAEPSKIHAVDWRVRTRTVWLPDGENSPMICLVVLTECRRVTDRHTDRQTDIFRQHSPLRSAATGTLLVPRARTATEQRSFAVNEPATCLPPALWSPDLSESAFKWAVKTHLFSTARCHWDVFIILAPDINIQTYLLTYVSAIDTACISALKSGLTHMLTLTNSRRGLLTLNNARQWNFWKVCTIWTPRKIYESNL